jgi:c-di-GMP-binding flagellar brake protein YcgR
VHIDITLGERLDVVIGERKCVSNLQDITQDGNMVLSQPMFRGVPMPIADGEPLHVVYYRPGGMFTFAAAVIRHFRTETGLELLELQPRGAVSKYQRRDDVRLNCAYGLKMRVLASSETVQQEYLEDLLHSLPKRRAHGELRTVKGEGAAFTDGTGIDISCGGMLFATKTPHEKDTLLEVSLMLPGLAPMAADALVVRQIPAAEPGESPRESVRYVHLSEGLRTVLAKFIFQEQVRRRK